MNTVKFIIVHPPSLLSLYEALPSAALYKVADNTLVQVDESMTCSIGSSTGSNEVTSLNAFEKHLKGAAPKHFTDVYLLMSPEAYHRSYGAEKACQLFFKGSGGPYCQLSGI